MTNRRSTPPRNDGRLSRSLLASLLLLPLLLLTACVTGADMRQDRQQLANSIAAKADMSPFRLDAGRFTFQGYTRIKAADSGNAALYIEGDGQAWRTYTQPSPNPTPTDPVGLRLAAQDTSMANVIYLARPCQYTRQWNQPGCPTRFWTSHRFAPVVIKSYMAALDRLKTRHDIDRFHLSGYSGGGAVATLLAARRDDVATLRTIAGNLDHARLNAYHNVTPMPDSVNPADKAGRLGDVAQIHYSGAADEIVPPMIAKSFIAKLALGTCARHRIIEGATHHNWRKFWPELAADMPAC